MLLAAMLAAGCTGAASSPAPSIVIPTSVGNADELMVVDCLLPGAVRKLGSKLTYLTARRPIKTSASDCGIRGGEYVAYDRANYATALQVWQPLADGGDPKAQNYVGEIHEKGLGVSPDHGTAAHWYRLAAEQGYAPAQINLGQLYEQGLGVARDMTEALSWYRRASGLQETNLPFVADGAAAREMTQLRQELSRSQGEAEKLRQQLLNVQEELERNREERRKLQEQGSGAREAQEKIAQLDAEIARLSKQAEKQRVEVASLSASQDVVLAGPSIHMIDPPLARTRGLEAVSMETTAEERLIVGRVEAPAGLMTLLVNEVQTKADPKGIFQTHVQVGEDGTPVTIVAIDNQGKRNERKFELRPASGSGLRNVDASPRQRTRSSKIDFGSYHALVIGNNAYRGLPPLETARQDATAIAAMLRDKYGFRVTELHDATRYQVLSALNQLRAQLTEKDNLVIYYAGHGEMDKVNMRGHWLPVDAERDSSANWISNVALTDILNSMSARHIMVMADSCYSGALTRSSLSRLEAGMTDEAQTAWRKAMVTKRSRTALTSGGVAPVLDAGGGKHSIFAKALLDVLGSNEEVLEGQRLFQEISARVTWAAEAVRFEQVPQYAPIKYAGHESGDFFLVPGS